MPTSSHTLLYLGTYTTRGSEGVYRVRMNLATGALDAPELALKAKNPTWLTVHPQGRYLYVGAAADGDPATPRGVVIACAYDYVSGELASINEQVTGGSSACHIAIDPTGRCLVATNYRGAPADGASGGSIAIFPLRTDGALAPYSQLVRHAGSGPHPERQTGSHPHSATFDPSGRRVLIADLGIDKVMMYQCDAVRAALATDNPTSYTVSPGAGPRHCAFHPNGRTLYLVNELGNTVDVCSYSAERGEAVNQQTIATLPSHVTPGNTAAEILVHPSGAFLYASNRGHDSIVAYRIDPADGRLSLLGFVPTQGRTPRGCGFAGDGRFLLVANQDSDTLIVFAIDPHEGTLTATGYQISVPAPVCVKTAA
jgi:6-phosphogluconolactonase